MTASPASHNGGGVHSQTDIGNNNKLFYTKYSTCYHSNTVIGHTPTMMGGAIFNLHTILYTQPYQLALPLLLTLFTFPYNFILKLIGGPLCNSIRRGEK